MGYAWKYCLSERFIFFFPWYFVSKDRFSLSDSALFPSFKCYQPIKWPLPVVTPMMMIVGLIHYVVG